MCFSQALMSWVKIDVASRKKDVSRLLSLVKLPLLTPSVRSCLSHSHSVDTLLRVQVKHPMKGYGGVIITGPFIINVAHDGGE